MIKALSNKTCANQYCKNPLYTEYAGNNIGGWKAHRLQNGDYETGYTCKRCGNQSTPCVTQIRNYQRLHYGSYTVDETKHSKDWQRLVASLSETEIRKDAPNNPKMPNWEQINGTQKKEAKTGK